VGCRGSVKTLHQINGLRLDYLAQRAPLAKARVLDVGCGGGLLCEGLAERGSEVLGIDLGADNVAAAQAHAAGRNLRVDYRCVDVETIAAEAAGGLRRRGVPRDAGACAGPEPHHRRVRRGGAPGRSRIFLDHQPQSEKLALAIVAAEYITGLVPRGTHEYRKLIRPAELARWCRSSDLEVHELTGLHLNPLTNTYWLGDNVDVNYFAYARRPVTA